MKRRFLATLLAVAMIATMFSAVTALADTAAIVGNFLDIDFNDWEALETTDKNGNSFTWGFNDEVNPTVVTDAEKGNKVLKFANSENSYVQLRHNLTDRDYFTRDESQWMEWSVKFEGGFAGVGYDHNNGFSPIFIDENGVVKKFAKRACASPGAGSDIVSGGYQLELDKWYHIVVLMDTVNAPGGDGGKIYCWVNGEKVFNGADFNSQFKVQSEGGSANWSYYRFFVENPQEGASVYIDNVKAYSTGSGLNDTHAIDAWDFEPTDLDENDDIYIAGNTIVAKGKTVAQIKAAFSGATFVADKEDEDSAADAIITAWADNGYAYKEYTVLDQDVATDILGKHATGIAASIGAANAAHPVEAMINDGMDTSVDGDVYKSDYKGSETPLVVTIPLDAYYALESVNIYERYLGGQRNVTIELGNKNEFTTVKQDVALNTSDLVCKTEIPFEKTEADTIRLTFTGTPANGQQTYQIYEIEAYGIKTGDRPADILAPIGSEGSGVAKISTSIPTSNSTYHPVTAMIDGVNTGDNVYKSKNDVTDDLVVTINLNAYYTLGSLTVYERYLSGSALLVDIELGKQGVFEKVVESGALATGTTHLTGTPTVFSFEYTETDTIRLTFTGTGPTGQAQKYQIFELEAIGEKTGDFPVRENLLTMEGVATSITASIPTRAKVHPVEGIIDGNREFHSNNGGTDNSLYKSDKGSYDAVTDQNDLKVLITLNDVYKINSVNVYTRVVGQPAATVDVALGNGGVFTEVASDVALSTAVSAVSSQENLIEFIPGNADVILLTFHTADEEVYTEESDMGKIESNYQIAEIEAYGELSDDCEISATGIIPGYCYWEETANSMVVAYSNATQEVIEASTFIAAYEGNKLVAISPVREMTINPGITAQYSVSEASIKQEGRTYKAFVFDSLTGLKPIMVAKSVG